MVDEVFADKKSSAVKEVSSAVSANDKNISPNDSQGNSLEGNDHLSRLGKEIKRAEGRVREMDKILKKPSGPAVSGGSAVSRFFRRVGNGVVFLVTRPLDAVRKNILLADMAKEEKRLKEIGSAMNLLIKKDILSKSYDGKGVGVTKGLSMLESGVKDVSSAKSSDASNFEKEIVTGDSSLGSSAGKASHADRLISERSVPDSGSKRGVA